LLRPPLGFLVVLDFLDSSFGLLHSSTGYSKETSPPSTTTLTLFLLLGSRLGLLPLLFFLCARARDL
jgi:hypothetical protein